MNKMCIMSAIAGLAVWGIAADVSQPLSVKAGGRSLVETQVAAKVVKVAIETSLGDIALELDAAKAPLSVSNFVAYAKSGHYKDTIFHRVINGFMIQGGGFTKEMRQKETRPPIRNEAANGLKNQRGTIAMARTMVVDSATCQFFINLKDNSFLDHTAPNPRQFGYAVFGRVTKGMDVVDKIAQVKTGSVGYFQDVPVEPVVIKSVKIEETVESAAQVSAATHFTNPVLKENWPDPAFWRGTNCMFYSVATGLRTIFASSNLIDWVDMRRNPLTTDAAAKLKAISRNWWAPCVKRLDGRWVLYVSHFNTDIDCSVSVLVSDSEIGPFAFVRAIVDGKALGIENSIDPFVVETEGRVWMFFGSDQDGIHRVELSRDGLHLKPGAEIVHVAGLRKKVPGKSQWGDRGCWEGSYLHSHGGWWYLFCSGGRYDIGDYHLTVGRAKRIDGIFYDRTGHPMTKGLAKPILASDANDRFIGPGHNGEVFLSADGREWMFFHAHDVTRERKSDRPTLLQELKWTADDWPYFDGGKPKSFEERFEVKRR